MRECVLLEECGKGFVQRFMSSIKEIITRGRRLWRQKRKICVYYRHHQSKKAECAITSVERTRNKGLKETKLKGKVNNI